MKKYTFLLLIATLFSFTNCQREEFQFDRRKQENIVGTIVIPGTTHIIQKEDLESELQNYQDGKLTLSGSGTLLSDVRQDDVLMIGVSDKTPYGALRKVNDIENNGDNTIITTSPATLEDAIKEGSVSFSTSLTAEDIQSTTFKDGVSIKKSRSLDGIVFDLDNVTLFENNAGLKVVVDGGISVKPEVNVSFDFQLFHIEKILT